MDDHVEDMISFEEILEQHETLMEMVPEMVVVISGNRCLYINSAGLQLLGLDSLDERSIWSFVHPDDIPLLQERAADLSAKGAPLSARYLKADGTPFDVEVRGNPIRYGGHGAWLLLVHDVTHEKRNRELLYRLAYYQPSTQLPNRTYLEEQMQKVVSEARESAERVAAVLIGIDHVKVISDSLGRAEGNKLIQEVAHRLSGAIPNNGLLAHVGFDEFAVLLPNQTDASLTSAIRDIHQAIAGDPVQLASRPTPVSCCIGVSVFPDDAQDEVALLRNADLALYSAKREGRNKVLYYNGNSTDPERIIEELELEQDLRFALQRNELYLAYQPKFNSSSGVMTGVEALLRWQHPTRGVIAPGIFIPIAESSGLIVPIGEWLLLEACRQQRTWAALDMAVNLSVRQLEQPDFVDTVQDVLRDTGADIERLEFEITESTFVRNSETVLCNLDALRTLGIRISIDDFGSGYASFGYLQRYHVDSLKIDQSFVRDLPQSGNSAAIVTSIITLARALGIDVIAEGVETAAQRSFLMDLGCRHMQGFLFARPETPADIGRRVDASVGDVDGR